MKKKKGSGTDKDWLSSDRMGAYLPFTIEIFKKELLEIVIDVTELLPDAG